MKPLLVIGPVIAFLTAFSYQNRVTKTAALVCTLTSNKTEYKVGELPELKIEIKNNTGSNIYLIGSLDGSDIKWRMPYCYFSIQKPQPDTIETYGRCGTLNPLRKEDFVLVRPGGKFNPYKNVDNYGFFPDLTITKKETFRKPGTYKLQFHYSTNSPEIAKFLFNPNWPKDTDSLQLFSLFKKMPKVDIVSNEIEIIITN